MSSYIAHAIRWPKKNLRVAGTVTTGGLSTDVTRMSSEVNSSAETPAIEKKRSFFSFAKNKSIPLSETGREVSKGDVTRLTDANHMATSKLPFSRTTLSRATAKLFGRFKKPNNTCDETITPEPQVRRGKTAKIVECLKKLNSKLKMAQEKRNKTDNASKRQACETLYSTTTSDVTRDAASRCMVTCCTSDAALAMQSSMHRRNFLQAGK